MYICQCTYSSCNYFMKIYMFVSPCSSKSDSMYSITFATFVIIAQLTEATEKAYDMTYTPVIQFCAIILSIVLVLTPIMVHFAPLIVEYILTPLFDACGLTTGKKLDFLITVSSKTTLLLLLLIICFVIAIFIVIMEH